MPASPAAVATTSGTTCPYVPTMNEAGFTLGTAVSIAGYIFGAWYSAGLNMYHMLIGAGSIYLGRWATDNYLTRLVSSAGTATGTSNTYTLYSDWLNKSSTWDASLPDGPNGLV